MNETTIQALRTAAQCETIQLENGMTVLVKPMEGYRDVHVICGTRFGSADCKFEMNGVQHTLPAGVAHFLEHKMFESEEGDAFAQYAAVGASANAYTSFDKTCYLFSTTCGVEKALDILLKLVSRGYFTKETVEKEQGIIGQEIKMYDDSPEWRMMFSLLQSMYHNHPVKDDIAGSEESIAQITPEMLYECVKAFYSPANLVLAAAGNISKQQILDAIERAGLTHEKPNVKKLPIQEPFETVCKYREFEMSVSKPMLGVGYKEVPPTTENQLKTALICDMLSELVCGAMTPFYRELYDSGLAGADFSGEFLCIENALCLMFCGETDQPEKVRELLQQEIDRLRCDGVNEELFMLCKNQMYGGLVCELDSTSGTAGALCAGALKGYTLYDEMSCLVNLTVQDIDSALQTMLLEENSVSVVIRPESEEEQDD